MKWRTYLLLAAVVNCWSVVQLGGIIYTLTNGNDHNDFTYNVRCFYNGTDPKPWDIQLMAENRTLETVSVDEFTISYEVNLAQLSNPEGLEFRCFFPNNHSEGAIISESTFLRTFHFYCTYSDIDTELHCHFTQFHKNSRFLLTMDNKYSANCSFYSEDWMKCNLQYPASFHGFNRSFIIEMDSHGILHKQLYHLTDIQMKKPYWPTTEPHVEQLGFTICLDFGPQAFNDSYSYIWRVFLKPESLKIQSHYAKIINQSDCGVCFEIPEYHYQTYEAMILVRFNHSDAPHTALYPKPRFTTKPSVPEEHGGLPIGFTYDQDTQEINVFWNKIDELLVNGPNFKHRVVTDTGKKPLYLGNDSFVVKNWDPTQPGTFSLWGQNSVGRSLHTYNLTVPILTNYKDRQPRNLQYHVENNTVTWDPPQEDKTLDGYFIIYCYPAATRRKAFCENPINNLLSVCHRKNERYYQLDDQKSPFTFALSANYLDDSSGGMIWYNDQSDIPERSPSFLSLEIIILIVSLTIFVLAAVIFYTFRKWKRKKVKEIRISLPPIFDPTVMARLRLRNVDFPSSPSPPIEIMPSISPPPRIFLDSMETTKIIGLSSANSNRTPDSSEVVDSPEVVDSSYTVMSAVQSTRTPNPPDLPDSVTSPYTEMDVMPDRFTYSQQK